MKSFYKRSRSLSITIILVLLIQLMLPAFVDVSYANNPDATLTVIQSIKDNKTTVSPNEEITVKLDYSTASTTTDFKDVELSYTLPHGAKFLGVTKSGHVTNSTELNNLGQDARLITFKLADNSSTEVLSAGATGYVEVTFKFPSPSVYPDGKTILLNDAELKGYLTANNNEIIAYSGEVITLDYVLVDTWRIIKDGPASVTISNNPIQNTLNVSYTISLVDGNIDLKDVEIVDTLPQNASFVSSSIAPESTDDGIVKWKLDDVPASQTTSINVVLEIPIIRNIGDVGVENGSQRTNTVTVTGYPVDLNSSGNVVKGSTPITFSQASDSITTTFNQSTQLWGVDTDGPLTKTITNDLRVDEIEVTYNLGLINGDIDLKDAQLIYQIPEDARYVSSSGGVYDNINDRVVWSYSDVSASSPPTENVTLAYAIDRTNSGVGVKNNSTRTNTVSGNGYPIEVDENGHIVKGDTPVIFNPSNDSITTTFIESDEKWYVEKSGPSSISIKSDDSSYTDDITYTIKLKSTGTGNYNTPISEITVTDTLPEFAEYVSSNTTPDTIDIQNGKITWVLNDVLPTNPPTITYRVKYPIDRDGDGNRDGIKPGDILTNNVSVEGYPVDGAGNKSSEKLVFRSNTTVDTDSTSTNSASQLAPQPSLSLEIQDYNKTTKDRNFNIGDEVVYLLDFDNLEDNEHTLYDVVLTDENLPAEIDYSEIKLGKSSMSIDYTFEYKTNKEDWVSYGGGYNTDSLQVINISSLSLDADEYLTGIRLSYTEIPVNFEFTEKIQLKGIINSTALDEADILNSAKLEYKHKEFIGFSEVKELNDNVSFKILIDSAWISLIEKNKLTESESYKHIIGDTLKFELKFTNHARLATSSFKNPILIDVVPKGFEFIETWEDWDSENPGVPKPSFVKYDNYPEEGLTTLKWYWDDSNSYNLLEGETITLKYDLKVLSYAGVGEHRNKFYLMSKGKYKVGTGITISSDDENLDKDAITNEYLEGKDCKIIIDETPALNSYKWVKGELDDYDGNKNGVAEEDRYNRYPDKGRTTPGGSADYKLEVVNAGNVYIKDIEIVDILPYEGDTPVLDRRISRGSTWTPYLIKELSQGVQGVVKDVHGDISNANVTVYYSTATDPIRPKGTGTIGTQVPNWSIQPPEDITSVRSLKFMINGFKDSKGLEPGSTIGLEWKMRSPVGAPIGSDEIAWNSISMSGTASRNGGDETLLPAEPKKVGIEVETNPIGEIGDFVWFDYNDNGIQDDGYDNESAGINGIKVKLYKEDTGNPGSFNEVDMTLTGNDDSGNPGYYLFPALETGNYYVSFELPTYYSIVTNDLGGNDDLDSDGYDDNGVIRTGVIHVDTSNDATRLIYNVDLGLKHSATAPSMDVTKEAIGYKKTDDTLVDFAGTKKPVNEGETIRYKIVVENNGSVPLNNIKLEDVMTNSGFKFTTAKFIDSASNETSFNSLSEDPNITITQGIDNILTLGSLDVDEKYEFYGEYKVLASDVTTSPITNTLKVWANELKDKNDPSSPVYEISESVDVAALRLEKTISQIDKGSSGSFVAYDSNNHAIEVGDTIRYKITAYNDGSIDLSDVTINDTKIGLSNYLISTITKGGSVDIEGVDTDYIVTESDLPGPITNTVTATDDDIRYNVDANNSADISDLTVTKTVSKINGSSPKKYSNKFVSEVGDEIVYSITLENTGSSDLEDVIITEETLASEQGLSNLTVFQDITCQIPLNKNGNDYEVGDISSGGAQTVYAKYVVQTDDVLENPNPPANITDTIVNTVKAKSRKTETVKEDSVDVEIADLEIIKQVDTVTSGLGPYKVGDSIKYDITVTNKGSIKLKNINVNDPMLSSITNSKITLEPGASQTLSGTYTVKDSDLLQGTDTDPDNARIVNTATASHSTISSNKESTKTIETKGISIKKSGVISDNGDGRLSAGDTITYTFEVKNIGSSDLTGVTISDDRFTLLPSESNIGDLGSGVTVSKTHNYTVVGTDLPGPIVNTATVSSNEEVEDSDTHYLGEPKVRINKYVYKGHDNGFSAQSAIDNNSKLVMGVDGTPVTYVLEVINSGDTYLKNIDIDDDKVNLVPNNNLILLPTLSDHGTYNSDTNLAGKDENGNGERLVFYYEDTITDDIINTASVSANPTTSTGEDIPGASNPSDIDTAEVKALASIGDYVWIDIDNDGVIDGNEEGIQGVTLNLYLANDETTVISSVYTNNDGFYQFIDLTSNDYTVKVDKATLPAGLIETYDLDGNLDSISRNITISNGNDRLDVDFGYNHTGRIGDTVWYDLNEDRDIDSGEIGIPNVRVVLKDNKGNEIEDTTDDNGNYLFENLPSGEYTVEIDKTTLPKGVELVTDPDSTKDGKNAVYINPGESILTVDFGYNYTGAIGDTVWYDRNEDGIQQNDNNIPDFEKELGIEGVKLNLYSSSDTSTVLDTVYTDEDGKYIFTDLDAGAYIVKIDTSTLPSGLVQVADPDSIFDHESTVIIGKDDQNLDMDFGYNHTGSIGNYVWYDMDKDDQQDSDEKGINGVTVILKDKDENEIKTTSTDINGNYIFTNLPAGDYIVTIDETTLPEGYETGYDLDGGLDNKATASILPGQNREDVDFGYKPIPHLSIIKTADKDKVEVGDIITYTITLINDGKTVLNNVYLEDEMLSINDYWEKLTVGESVYSSKAYEVTQFDVDNAKDDVIVNIAKARSNETGEVEDKHEATLNTNPKLEIVKIASKSPIKIGDTILYTLTATNKGDIVLHNVYLKDDMLSIDEFWEELTVGQSVYATGEYEVSKEDLPGPIVNVATVESDETGKMFSKICMISISNPILEVVKKAPNSARIGEEIDFLFTVKNNGNTVIEDVYFEDEMLDISKYLGELEIGDSKTWSESYIVDESDWPGTILNTAIVSGTVTETVYSSVYGGTVYETVYTDLSSESSTSTIVIANPILDIEKTADKSTAKVGESITYTITVTNKGDVTLTNVKVVDDMLGINETIEKLLVDGSKTFTGTYKVAKDDEADRKVINIVTADSDQTASVSDTVEVEITKKSSGGGSGGSEPEEPEEPETPTEPETPVEPEIPTEPEQPEDPETPDQPDQSTETDEDTPVDGTVEVPEGSIPSISEEPINGKVTIDEDGNWKYEPNPGFIGKDKFKVKIVDEVGNEEEVIIEIEVIPSGFANTLPKTGEVSNILLYILGFILIVIGVALRKKLI